MDNRRLPRSFYTGTDVVSIARNLLGMVLCTRLNETISAGRIVETEAYRGTNDKACHANNGKRTDRTETMYRQGGVAYVYLCYGIHHLFNVVTNREDTADAVLIRALEPVQGIPEMLARRGCEQVDPALTAGPGRLTEALGITTGHDGTDLMGSTIWIEDRGMSLNVNEIGTSSRIGVEYAGEHADRPWRFYASESRWISK